MSVKCRNHPCDVHAFAVFRLVCVQLRSIAFDFNTAAAVKELAMPRPSLSPAEPLRFGTVGAPQTTPKPGGTPLAIAHSRALGLDHLEIAWVQSVRVTDEACAAIKAAAEQHAISLSVHAPYFINLNSQTAELMQKSDERLLMAARKGFLAGARDIIFHPASYHNQPPEKVYERVREKLLELTAILRAEGVAVTLRPETMGKPAMFGTLEEVIQLSQDVEGVLPAIDFAHLRAAVGTTPTRNSAPCSKQLKTDSVGAA
jgi:deoxyribonuclease-4